MAKIMIDLPEYVIRKKRATHCVYYFQVPARIRPEGWAGAIRLGRDDKEGMVAIFDKAIQLKQMMDGEKKDNELGVVRGHPPGTIPDVIKKYKESEFWNGTRLATRAGYDRMIRHIERWSKAAGHPHVATMKSKHIYAFLSQYSDRPRQQQYLKAVFSILMNVAMVHGYIDGNPVKDFKLTRRRGGKKQKLVPWSEKDLEAFMIKADAMGHCSIATAALIAYETSQRQTDVLNMQQPRDYRRGHFVFEQSKTGESVDIPATERLRARLATIPKTQLLLCTCEGTGRRWDAEHFSHRVREIADAAGLPDHIFKQLRHSHVINLERAGCTISEIASHTGHSRETVKKMLDQSYGLRRDKETAKNAVTKLESYRAKTRKAQKRV